MKLIGGFNLQNSYAALPKIFYSEQSPAIVRNPQLILFNTPLADSLGLDFNGLSIEKQAQFFSGHWVPEGAKPLAQAYAGHQFGHFNMLGDGRALLLGEHLSPQGELWDVQLKGSGPTPYSRGGDGRAALGPMLREYIMSEAMHALGIPTTRSLAVVTTGEPVQREKILSGAILTRIASSHIRVGTFEYLHFHKDLEFLKIFTQYTINRHYPDLKDRENPVLDFLYAVIERQVQLIVHWWRVGFIHGVMNTDNMSIAGETIDYGPCAFMNTYDPSTVFSSIDRSGRYRFENQSAMAQWNLARLAEVLLPLLHSDQQQALELAEGALYFFGEFFQKNWLAMMRKKIGLTTEEDQDRQLIQDLLHWMQKNKVDYTNTFRMLSVSLLKKEDLLNSDKDEEFVSWQNRWRERLGRQSDAIEGAVALMHASNPAFIPRNHKVEEALSEATMTGDLTLVHRLLGVLKQPYSESPSFSDYQMLPPFGDSHYKTFCGT